MFNDAAYEVAKDVLTCLNRIERKIQFMEDDLTDVADELVEVRELLVKAK